MRAVSDDPESIRPRDDSACTAFAFVVEHGEAWVNAGDGARFCRVESRDREDEWDGEKRLHAK